MLAQDSGAAISLASQAATVALPGHLALLRIQVWPGWPRNTLIKQPAVRRFQGRAAVETWVDPVCGHSTQAAACVTRQKSGLTQFPTAPP